MYDIVRPDPEKEIHSLRSFGYTIETAIADLIDNSIAAKSNHISIVYEIDTYGSFLRIEDNGKGMSEIELVNAMKMGSFDPLDKRSDSDLGRFGLGLKTASFSQCKRLSVLSNNGQEISFRAWDIDKIHEYKEWVLYKDCLDANSKKKLGKIESSSGTVILWEKMDRLIETKKEIIDKENMYRKFQMVKTYISLVFHRFLENGSISISINGEILKPTNPFYPFENIFPQELQESFYKINNSRIIIKPYILPHEARLPNQEIKKYDIVRGWIEHQGIYLYRNDRLIIDGSWMDLNFRKRESQRLVRISIDISNALDKEWQIDVRKASAKIPDAIRKNITSICTDAIVQGIKVYTHRGVYVRRKDEKKKIIHTWICKRKNGERSYMVNPQHPLYILICDLLGENRKIFKSYIKTIDSMIPLNLIINDSCDENVVLKVEDEALESKRKIFKEFLKAITSSGMDEISARTLLMTTDMFNKHTDLL